MAWGERSYSWCQFAMSSLGAPSRYMAHHGASEGAAVGRTCTRPRRGTTTVVQTSYALPPPYVTTLASPSTRSCSETDLRQLGRGFVPDLAAGDDERVAPGRRAASRRHGATEATLPDGPRSVTLPHGLRGWPSR